MNPLVLVDHIPVLPEALLLVGACVVMIVDLYVKSERRTLSLVLAQGVLALCALVTLLVLAVSHPAKYYLFNGLFVADSLSHLLKLACYVAVSAALVYSRAWLADRPMSGPLLYATVLSFALAGWAIVPQALTTLGAPASVHTAPWANLFLGHAALDRRIDGGLLIGEVGIAAWIVGLYLLILLSLWRARRRRR